MILIEHNFLYSILVSLLLINGFYNLGFQFRYVTNSLFLINNLLFSAFINFFLIINLIAIITFNFLLFNELNINLIKIISLGIIIFGFYKPLYLYCFKNLFVRKDYKLTIIYLILFFYFILSLNPITDPDSLDYHFTIPYYQVEFGNSQFYKYWLHSQLSGAGESLFLYSIVLGGFHFSQILQFTSLLIIILIFLNFEHNKLKVSNQKKIFACLSLLSMPVLLFLVSTSKPQLFPIATNFLCLLISFFYLKQLENKNLTLGFIILVFLLFASTQMKFSFLLSSGLILIFSIYLIYNKSFFTKSIIIILVLFTFVILPREIFEFINFNRNFIYNFFNPVTDLYGADAMNSSLRHGSGNSRYLIFWLFIPYDQLGNIHIGELTYCLGPFVLYFLFNYNLKIKIVRNLTIIYLIYFIAALVLAQPVGRFYIEIFIWMLFFSIFYFQTKEKFFQKFFSKVLILFSSLFIIVLGYFSLSLFKGNFSKNLYDEVLSNNADGYLLYKWANEVIPDNSIILSTHRSSAFYKHEVVSYEFRLFGGYTADGYNYYLNEIIKKKPQYILYKSTEINDKRDILKNCRGELFKYKKNVGYVAGRNPFRTYKNYYDGYIYKISNKEIKECIK